ncbi:MAG: hypothetical protein CME98_09295 [Hyphomonas sp.]|nr:hypothetical protein [Hyphomonas sp.]
MRETAPIGIHVVVFVVVLQLHGVLAGRQVEGCVTEVSVKEKERQMDIRSTIVVTIILHMVELIEAEQDLKPLLPY